MGKDEHNKAKVKNHFAQTPKNQSTDHIDVEFSQVLADEDDREAQERAQAANNRVKD